MAIFNPLRPNAYLFRDPWYVEEEPTSLTPPPPSEETKTGQQKPTRIGETRVFWEDQVPYWFHGVQVENKPPAGLTWEQLKTNPELAARYPRYSLDWKRGRPYYVKDTLKGVTGWYPVDPMGVLQRGESGEYEPLGVEPVAGASKAPVPVKGLPAFKTYEDLVREGPPKTPAPPGKVWEIGIVRTPEFDAEGNYLGSQELTPGWILKDAPKPKRSPSPGLLEKGDFRLNPNRPTQAAEKGHDWVWIGERYRVGQYDEAGNFMGEVNRDGWVEVRLPPPKEIHRETSAGTEIWTQDPATGKYVKGQTIPTEEVKTVRRGREIYRVNADGTLTLIQTLPKTPEEIDAERKVVPPRPAAKSIKNPYVRGAPDLVIEASYNPASNTWDFVTNERAALNDAFQESQFIQARAEKSWELSAQTAAKEQARIEKAAKTAEELEESQWQRKLQQRYLPFLTALQQRETPGPQGAYQAKQYLPLLEALQTGGDIGNLRAPQPAGTQTPLWNLPGGALTTINELRQQGMPVSGTSPGEINLPGRLVMPGSELERDLAASGVNLGNTGSQRITGGQSLYDLLVGKYSMRPTLSALPSEMVKALSPAEADPYKEAAARNLQRAIAQAVSRGPVTQAAAFLRGQRESGGWDWDDPELMRQYNERMTAAQEEERQMAETTRKSNLMAALTSQVKQAEEQRGLLPDIYKNLGIKPPGYQEALNQARRRRPFFQR